MGVHVRVRKCVSSLDLREGSRAKGQSIKSHLTKLVNLGGVESQDVIQEIMIGTSHVIGLRAMTSGYPQAYKKRCYLLDSLTLE